MITETQYICQQEDILSEMVALLDEARRCDDLITDYTDDRLPLEERLALAKEVRRLTNVRALKMVAYTGAQAQMVNSMIEFHDSGKPAASLMATFANRFSSNRLHS